MNTPSNPRLLIFTDLDGTLLDHDTYEFSPALPALAAMRSANLPLVLCSSKTGAEMKYWSGLLNIDHPFISENGGALSIPQNYFAKPFDYDQDRDGRQQILMGVPYSALRAALIEIALNTYLPLVGFGDLTAAQIAARTGLPLEQARLAKMRDADEPFFIDREFGDEEIKRLESAAALKKLQITRGGRFFHLTGKNDKGAAARRLVQLYQAEWRQPVRTAGLGDSLNDLPLLQAVDIPILVRKKSGEADPTVQSNLNVQCTRDPGPSGWNEAVLELLQREVKSEAGVRDKG